MNQDDLSLLLAILGGTYMLTAMIGKVTGDAARDVRLMAATGISLVGLAGATLLA
jgi:hypothetical protein